MSTINLNDAWKIINSSLDITTGERGMPSNKNGMIQFLLSDANTSAATVKLGPITTINKGNGKVYKMSRDWFPRQSFTGAEGLQYCPTDGKKAYIYSDEVEITKRTTSKPIEIDDELMRCIRMGKAEYTNKFYAEYVRTHLNKLAQDVAAVAALKAGNFVKCACDDAPVTCKNLPLFFSSVGLGVNPVGQFVLDRDMKNADIVNDFVLIGGGLLDFYMGAKQLASGNQLGFDASLQQVTNSIFFDPNLSLSLGSPNKILAVSLGAMQLITYARHKGEFVHNTEYQKRTTVVDPFYDIEHDLLISIEDCGNEVKMYMQIETTWDVIGLPDCAFQDDCLYDGVKDVFCYTVVCADTQFCDVDSPCGVAGAPGVSNAVFCASATECEVNCNAQFYSECSERVLFVGANRGDTTASGMIINGLVVSAGGVFNLNTEAGGNAFIAAMQAALAAFGSIVSVSGGWDGSATDVHIVTDSTVLTVFIIIDGGANIDMVRTVQSLVHVWSTSTASTNATLTDLSWTTPAATFNGAPTASILNEAGYYGTMQDFYAIVAEGGAYQLAITDSSACADTYNATTFDCPDSFVVTLRTFEDTDNSDILDGAEAGLANVKVNVYSNTAMTSLVDSEVSAAVTGNVVFNLTAGTYYVAVDYTFGAAIGNVNNITFPLVLIVDVDGTIIYPGWTDAPRIPIGTV